MRFLPLTLLLVASVAVAQPTADPDTTEPDETETLGPGLDALVDSLRMEIDSLRTVRASLVPKPNDAWSSGYTVTLGPTFDLLDGLNATDLYGEVRIFRPGLLTWSNRTFGLDAGLIRGRTLTTSDTTDAPTFSRVYAAPGADSVVVARTSGGRSHSQNRIDYLTLYASLLLPVRGVAGNAHLYGVLHAELRSEDLLRTIATTGQTVEVEAVQGPPPGRPFPLRLLPDEGPVDDVTRRFEDTGAFGQFGVGALLQNRDAAAGVGYRLKTVFGVRDDLRRFYLVQFDLAERSSGFRLGGEIAGLGSGSDESGLLPTFDAPRVTVYLSKTFSLQRLAEFIAK